MLGPFKNYPQITVYHPNEGNGHDFVNVGWSGWIGSITGKHFNSVSYKYKIHYLMCPNNGCLRHD